VLNHALILRYLFLRSFFYGVSAIGSLLVVGTQEQASSPQIHTIKAAQFERGKSVKKA